MINLYIASVEPAGKTVVCASIGKKLISQGKKVGFFMPARLAEKKDAEGLKDVAFIKTNLELDETPETLSPISLSQKELWDGLTDESDDLLQKVKRAYTAVAKGKDVVLMEGLSGVSIDNVSTLACYRFAETLDARVIIVLRYSTSLAPSNISRVVNELGQRLIGVIVSFVPESKLEAIGHNITAQFQEAGIRVLGIFPEKRTLLGMSVGEMAEILKGEVVTCPDDTGELVENIMLGAMTINSGIDYFNRMANKAVVVRGDRPDMQMAALETSTKCLVLTNGIKPIPTVMYQSESKHVPIIVVEKDTPGTVTNLEEALTRTPFNSPQKLKKFEEIVGKNLDFQSISEALSLTG
jgi:BioD-like phosphotransacetylase family protein